MATDASILGVPEGLVSPLYLEDLVRRLNTSLTGLLVLGLIESGVFPCSTRSAETQNGRQPMLGGSSGTHQLPFLRQFLSCSKLLVQKLGSPIDP